MRRNDIPFRLSSSLFSFLYLGSVNLGSTFFYFTLLNIARSLLVAAELIFIRSHTACHGAEVCIVSKQLRHRNIGFDDLLAVMVGIHTQYTAASAV